MVVIEGSASKSQRGPRNSRAAERRWPWRHAGIELSCLSTISRSVSVMQRNKSAQAPVSVRVQVLGVCVCEGGGGGGVGGVSGLQEAQKCMHWEVT